MIFLVILMKFRTLFDPLKEAISNKKKIWNLLPVSTSILQYYIS